MQVVQQRVGASRTLAGLTFTAHSPSLYEFHGALVGYDGHQWRVGALGHWDDRLAFKTAQEAALAVLAAFTEHKENLG